MHRILAAVAVICALFAAHALAFDTAGQPALTKRQKFVQILGCMRKRMSDDGAISYNAATKSCKDQVNKRGLNSALDTTLVASDAQARQ
jgi:hypothetical protein